MNKQQIKGSAKEDVATKRDLKTRKGTPTNRDREMIRDMR